MKVKDLMHKRILSVTPDQKITDVARIIFNVGISGVPVVKEKKLIGIVTEEDILRAMFPTLQDFIEDSFGSSNFYNMEEKLQDLVHKQVSFIMNTNVTAITQNTELMKAQSLMLLNKFSRLPVVDSDNKLIGIISQGDIFKYLISKELPEIERSQYASFIGENYGGMVSWNKRFGYELPILFELFRKHNVEKIIDLGSWTGEYACQLARNNYQVYGLDSNDLMTIIANENRQKLEYKYRKKVTFITANYLHLSKYVNGCVEAVISMGNSLPYILVDKEHLFRQIHAILSKNGIFVCQMLNFNKFLNRNRRLISYNIKKKDASGIKETIHMEFVNESDSDLVDHHIAAFDYDGNSWLFAGLTSIKAQHFTADQMQEILIQAGFKSVVLAGNQGEYQGEYGPLSFSTPYNHKEHDWLNVLAIK